MRPFWPAALITVVLTGAGAPFLGRGADVPARPWMDQSLSPDRRADLLIQQMTMDEKITVVSGLAGYSEVPEYVAPPGSLGGDGFVPGVPRLGIPGQQEIGSGLGMTNLGKRPNRDATAFPSGIAQAATWNPELAYEVGVVIGREVRAHGFNIHLGAGVNLAREPRCGRTFEWTGEDPFLAGKMVAPKLRGVQSQGVVSTSHIYAMNDQEGGRTSHNAIVDERAMRESDLLAFEFAITESNVGAVMCSYNLVNGVYACENKYLLNDVLKRDWGFRGYVMSDWGAVHSTVPSAMAGLDQESANAFHPKLIEKYKGLVGFYGPNLKKAVEAGEIKETRLNDMVHRVLRTMFANRVIDDPPKEAPIDFAAGAEVARRVAEQSIVLLKNAGRQLPLGKALRSVAVIGAHADAGVLAGGGSSLVPSNGLRTGRQLWHPSSPLKAIRAKLPGAAVQYDAGTDVASAAKLAKASDVALVFVWQYMSEGSDVPDLLLPQKQNELVAQVAAANPHTIVILETGGPVLMPWIDKVPAVLEAWYPGIRGGEAIADLLFGDVNPAGRLPITFPVHEEDLPHPVLTRPPERLPGANPAAPPPIFDVRYTEGVKAGYKWYDVEHNEPLFPFGFGLSYTNFDYSNLKVSAGKEVAVSFDIRNSGSRPGRETGQVYLGLPASAGEPPKRLVGFQRVEIRPGQKRHIQLSIDPRMLAIFDVQANNWHVLPGVYQLWVGASSRDLRLAATTKLGDQRIRP